MQTIDNTYVAWGVTVAAVAYSAYLTAKCCSAQKSNRVNHSVELTNPKVVQSFDIEDLGNKAVFCRCWKSKKFPYCDGAHAKHNENTGDNVGPLIIQKKN